MRISAAASNLGIGRRSAVWRAAVWILLLTFTLQSFITQTHIHAPAQTVERFSAAKQVAPHGQNPADRDQSTCPFCQATNSAGVFFTPAAPALLLPMFWAEIPATVAPVSFVHHATTLGWQSRAPPQH